MITTDLQSTIQDNHHLELTLFPTVVFAQYPYKLSFHWMIWKFSVIYNEPKSSDDKTD
jgi:hypothetical protein